ncbi:MAG: HD domain-containing protein [Bergeyella zoohelcum]|nr:HD domain-containing protein [Bergeyella zoohelcum]
MIPKTIEFVKQQLANAEAGHDWSHTERVWKLAQYITETETCNRLIVELSALLHDVADAKFHNGNEELALEISEAFLKTISLPEREIQQVLFIIKNISFKNKDEVVGEMPIELKIVQDADRLDAIGAIGIARTFNFGGFKNNIMYDPAILPKVGMSKEEYKRYNGTTINHFYEKLLLLKEMMHTRKAKEIAEQRHQYMEQFLDAFYKEWNVEL